MNYESDKEKMQVALEQAWIAYDKEEIPVEEPEVEIQAEPEPETTENQ